MSPPPNRSLLRASFDSISVAWGVSVGVSAAASLSASAADSAGNPDVLARLGLLAAPLALCAVSVCAVLPWFWGATRGLTLGDVLARRSKELVLAGPVVVAGWWLAGVVSLRILAAFSERPVVGGLALAGLAVVVATLGTSLVEQGARLWKGRGPKGGVALAVCAGFVMFAVTTSVLVGNPSGSGAPWALFGVFKRPELDLSGVGLLAVSTLGAVVLSSLWVRGRSRAGTVVVGSFALALAVVGLIGAARLDFKGAVAVQRTGGLAASSLQVMQRLSDADGDGSAAWFGGGDCDDEDSQVHPAATEDYDNDRDDNCDGVKTRPELELQQAAPAPEGAPIGATTAKLASGLNVLLLTIDTARAELGYSGLPGTRPDISPQLDALARRSTVFERAYSLASYTSKSLGPMLIGTYPSETPRSFEHFDRFPKEAKFIQERVSDAGIQTLSVQGYWYFYFKGYGFERGWETLEHGAAPRVIAIEGDRTKNGDKVADDAIMYLKQIADRPSRFFMWTHWVDPHAEYVAHEAHDYGRDERARYDGEVSFVDAQVGRILSVLDETRLAERTVVIVTSDHGEAFGEHGMIRHGFEVWEELVHVPLLVHVPGVAARRVSQRRSLIDIAPTIAQALELPVDSQAFAGKSLMADVLRAKDSPGEIRPVLVDMPEGPHNKERRAFYSGDHKLIVSAGRVLGLYDLEADPGEKTDLSEDAALTAKIRAEYDAFIAELRVVPAKK